MIGCNCGASSYGGVHTRGCPVWMTDRLAKLERAGDELAAILRPMIDRAVDRGVASALDDWKIARHGL